MHTPVGSEKLRQRVTGLSLIESFFSSPLEDILRNYSGRRFRNSLVDKQIFFNECLSLNLSEDSENLLADRCKMIFHKDMRTSVEYGLDLVFGWLSEDLILQELRARGVSVQLAGEDRHREFLPVNEIGTTSDFRIELNGTARPLEIVFSWNNYWKKVDSWDIRDSKFRHLTIPGKESLCLGIELPSLEGFLIDMKNVKDSFTRRPNPAWGNKISYTLIGVRSQLKSINTVLSEFHQIE
jgi:hypothetical protein